MLFSDRGLGNPVPKNNHTDEDEGFRLPAGVRPVHCAVELDVDLVARWHSGEASKWDLYYFISYFVVFLDISTNFHFFPFRFELILNSMRMLQHTLFCYMRVL